MLLNKNNVTNQRVYADDAKLLMEDVEVKGSSFADKLHEILVFYVDNHGQSIMEMALTDAGFIERLSKRLMKDA